MLEAIVEELKILKAEGVEGVYLEEATLDKLRSRVGSPAAAPGPQTREGKTTISPPDKAPALAGSKSGNPPRSAENLMEAWKSAKDGPSEQARQASSDETSPPAATLPAPKPFTLPDGDKKARWSWLRERVLDDPVCRAHVKQAQGRKVVFGVGNLDARVFFCGEAPGADEEIEGEPFVGPAGQLLNKIIGAMGLARESVYIGNIMNWRPEHDKPFGNRPPTVEEMAYCLPYLEAQVEIVQPSVIVALGGTAAHGLLGYDAKRTVGRTRGRWLEYRGRPLVVTYHPSYLLHNDTMKAKRQVWEDMLMVMERLEMPISERQRAYFT